MKKILTLAILLLGLSNAAFAREDVTIYLFYASWNANSHKAQVITSKVAETYQKNVGYKAFDVDSDETYKFIKKTKLALPKTIPSIVIVDKHNNILSTTPYRNQDETKLKNLIDSGVLPNI